MQIYFWRTSWFTLHCNITHQFSFLYHYTEVIHRVDSLDPLRALRMEVYPRCLLLFIHMTRDDIPHVSTLARNVHDAIAESHSSRFTTYSTINPLYVTHSVYSERHTVNDCHRISFTRLRVSGHSLAIETGRWNRRGRGRLPVEERLCECGAVQSEQHVIERCPRTQ